MKTLYHHKEFAFAAPHSRAAAQGGCRRRGGYVCRYMVQHEDGTLHPEEYIATATCFQTPAAAVVWLEDNVNAFEANIIARKENREPPEALKKLKPGQTFQVEATDAGLQYIIPGAEKRQRPNATQLELLL